MAEAKNDEEEDGDSERALLLGLGKKEERNYYARQGGTILHSTLLLTNSIGHCSRCWPTPTFLCTFYSILLLSTIVGMMTDDAWIFVLFLLILLFSFKC